LPRKHIRSNQQLAQASKAARQHRKHIKRRINQWGVYNGVSAVSVSRGNGGSNGEENIEKAW